MSKQEINNYKNGSDMAEIVPAWKFMIAVSAFVGVMFIAMQYARVM